MVLCSIFRGSFSRLLVQLDLAISDVCLLEFKDTSRTGSSCAQTLQCPLNFHFQHEFRPLPYPPIYRKLNSFTIDTSPASQEQPAPDLCKQNQLQTRLPWSLVPLGRCTTSGHYYYTHTATRPGSGWESCHGRRLVIAGRHLVGTVGRPGPAQ